MDYLTEYDPSWPAWFAEITCFLRPRLPAGAGLAHVGSTSVVGMVAKPIIDIDIVAHDDSLADTLAAVVRAGYVHQGNLGFPGREAFRADHADTRRLPPHHLYLCAASSPELRKHLSFREYLRAHPAEARRLSGLKRRLAFEQRASRSEYIAAKAPLTAEIAAAALAWYG